MALCWHASSLYTFLAVHLSCSPTPCLLCLMAPASCILFHSCLLTSQLTGVGGTFVSGTFCLPPRAPSLPSLPSVYAATTRFCVPGRCDRCGGPAQSASRSHHLFHQQNSFRFPAVPVFHAFYRFALPLVRPVVFVSCDIPRVHSPLHCNLVLAYVVSSER